MKGKVKGGPGAEKVKQKKVCFIVFRYKTQDVNVESCSKWFTCSSVSARFSCTKRKHNISGNQRKPIFLDEIRTAFFLL